MEDLERRLSAGLDALQIEAIPEQRSKLLAFLALLGKWNRTYSLTAIRDAAEGVNLHLLDSLTVHPYLAGDRVLDIGTGAGLPGIPLSIMNPLRSFVLLDCNPKKTRFVQQAVIELGLKNVDVVTCRVEQYRPDRGFNSILVRAYGELAAIVAETRRLLGAGGKLLAQKGRFPADELAKLDLPGALIHRLQIPAVDADRHLVEIVAD